MDKATEAEARQLLAEPCEIAPGKFKPYGDCTAEDLRSARFLEGAGLSLSVSGSFGLATYPEDGNTVPTILRAADTMMYEAKVTRDSVAVSGKGTVSKAAKSASDSGPRQAVAGMFLERDSLPRG